MAARNAEPAAPATAKNHSGFFFPRRRLRFLLNFQKEEKKIRSQTKVFAPLPLLPLPLLLLHHLVPLCRLVPLHRLVHHLPLCRLVLLHHLVPLLDPHCLVVPPSLCAALVPSSPCASPAPLSPRAPLSPCASPTPPSSCVPPPPCASAAPPPPSASSAPPSPSPSPSPPPCGLRVLGSHSRRFLRAIKCA